MNTERSTLGEAVIQARADEVTLRCKAQRLEREASLAAHDWKRAIKVRERAELWLEADKLRKRLAEVENAAGGITL